MQPVLGIDLGTTNSVAAHMRRGEPQIIAGRTNTDLTPSVVSRGRRGELLVGAAAKGRAASDPENTIISVKRFMGRRYADPNVQHALRRLPYKVSEGTDGDVRIWFGGRDYTPTEISSLILHRIKEDAEARLGERLTRAVITVPAYFGERQVAATREAGRMAGFQVLRIINEPTAAALAYGLNREDDGSDKIILVYDLGGGTFDISIMMLTQGVYTVMGIEGNNFLGGDDFDSLLMQRLLQAGQFHFDTTLSTGGKDLEAIRTANAAVRAAAESTKIVLSSAMTSEVTLPALGPQGTLLETDVSREEFESMIRDYINQTIELTRKAIREAYLMPNNIDHIVLVGGSTAIPLVERAMKEIFGAEKIRKDVNPMHCVALGAAIQGALISELECPACQTRNAVQDDHCVSCRAPLFGGEKVSCPQCFMLSDGGEGSCWKCGQPLGDRHESSTEPVAKPAAEEVYERCPACGKANKRGATTCVACNRNLMEQGGLKCRSCDSLNSQGATTCSNCGNDLPITDVEDVIPMDIGFELQDGSMEVRIPKGSPIPKEPTPIVRDYYTAAAGQRTLEVKVYEGPAAVARENNLLGTFTTQLPEGMPRSTAVTITFALDRDRTLTVAAKLRTPDGLEASRKIPRDRIDSEQRRKIQERREQTIAFMEQWNEELTDAERRDLYALIADLDRVMSGDATPQGKPLAVFLEQAKERLALATDVRGMDALISGILYAVENYLETSKREQLAHYGQALAAARQRADWVTANILVKEAQATVDDLGGNLLTIVYARSFASHNQLSPALTQRVMTVLWSIDEGAKTGSRERLDQGMDDLHGLWDSIAAELEKQGRRAPIITKVTKGT